MTKNYLLFYICYLLSYRNTLHAVCKLQVNISNTQAVKYTLTCLKYDKGMPAMIDSFTTNTHAMSHTFIDSSGLDTALYFILINNKDLTEVILSPAEHPVLSGTLGDFKEGRVGVSHSIENEAYYKFQQILIMYDSVFAVLEKKKNSIDNYVMNYYSQMENTEQVIFSNQAAFNDAMYKIRQQYPGTYTARELIPLSCFPTPAGDIFYETNRSFLIQHYFDPFINCSSGVVNHYLLPRKMEGYFKIYYPNLQDKASAFQRLFDATKHNQDLQNYIVEYLVSYFYSNMNEDAIEQLNNIWFSSSCSTERDTNVSGFVRNLLKFKVGNTVENILLPDGSFNVVSLNDVVSNHQLTMLLFWKSDCHTCEEQLPLIHSIYEKYKKDNKLEVYAVALDNNADKWKKIVSDKNYSWINVIDKNKLTMKQYSVRQTPTLLAIDHSGKIIFKNIFGFELENKIKLINWY